MSKLPTNHAIKQNVHFRYNLGTALWFSEISSDSIWNGKAYTLTEWVQWVDENAFWHKIFICKHMFILSF